MEWTTVNPHADKDYTIRINQYRIFLPAELAKNYSFAKLYAAQSEPGTYAFELTNEETTDTVPIAKNRTYYINKSCYKNLELPEGKYEITQEDGKIIFKVTQE